MPLSVSPLVALDFKGIKPSVSGLWTDVAFWRVANTVSEIQPVLESVWADCLNGYQAVGWLSYEAASAFDTAFSCVSSANDQERPPLVVFAVVDPSKVLPLPEREADSLPADMPLLDWTSSVDQNIFQTQLAAIHQAIRNGETYQVNLTHRLESLFEGDVWAWYRALSQSQQAGYNAFLRYADWGILSCSPELFFEWEHEQGYVKAMPMKGTVARAPDAAGDKDRAAWLASSEKNRAENVMIVDLLRNDLSRVASHVEVLNLFNLERYSTVWQMTSTVKGTIPSHIRWIEVLSALFPCGSVVGAPKLKTAEYIARLEASPRGVYCGAFGWVSATRAVFNVPIRTVQWNAQTHRAVYGVGNGLTIDSTADEEWAEIEAKCRFLGQKIPENWSLIETLYWSPDEGFRYIGEHLERLVASAEYWDWVKAEDISALLLRLKEHVYTVRELADWSGSQRIKLIVSSDLKIAVEAEVWGWVLPQEALPVVLAKEPIPMEYDRRFLCHKTTYREVYEQARLEKPEWAWDVLLWNAEGELTEFSNGNLAIELNGEWLTPPVASGVLPGIARRKALENGQLKESRLDRDRLKRASRIMFLNSLRGWVPVKLQEKE